VVSGNQFATVHRIVGATEPLAEIVIASRAERMLVAIEVHFLVASDQGELSATAAVAIGHATKPPTHALRLENRQIRLARPYGTVKEIHTSDRPRDG
jgi:hypothetical protein